MAVTSLALFLFQSYSPILAYYFVALIFIVLLKACDFLILIVFWLFRPALVDSFFALGWL